MSSPTLLQRWVSYYRATALMVFTTLVVFVAANALLWAVFKVKDASLRRRPISGPEEKYRSETLAAVYPNLTAEDRGELLHETWSRPVIFEDFVHFRERPSVGKYVNVMAAGFRLAKDQGPWPPDPANLNIFVFGGSTTFGYGVADWQTVPSHFQQALAQRSAGKRFCVYNFGVGFYYSTQERILFERLLTEGFTPDVAVFVDGINECGWLRKPMFRERFEKAFARTSDSVSGAEICSQLLDKTSFGRVGRIARKSVSPKETTAEETHDEAAAARIVPTYLANKRLVEAVCGQFGVMPVFVWQPCPYYKYDLKHHPFARSNWRWPEVDIVYPEMRKRNEGGELGKNFLWCADIQEGKSESLYVDELHYSDKFSNELAELISALCIERGLLPSSGK